MYIYTSVCMTYCMSLLLHSLGESEVEATGKALGMAGANVKPETCNSELDGCNINNSNDLQNEKCCRCATILSMVDTSGGGFESFESVHQIDSFIDPFSESFCRIPAFVTNESL